MSLPSRVAGRLAALPSGRFTKWLMLVVWLVIVGAAIPLSGNLSSSAKSQDTVELPRGAQSTQVEAVSGQFPGGKVSLGIAIYVRDSGITAADRAKAAADRQVVAPFAVRPVGPAQESADGKALILQIPLNHHSDKTLSTDAEKVRTAIQSQVPSGLQAKLTGPAGANLDASDAAKNTGKVLAAVTGIVVIVLLLLIYRSPMLALLPIVMVGAAFLVTNGVADLFAAHAGMTVDTGNGLVVTVLVFGVGTDYALLLLARYREELRKNEDRHVAMAIALRKAVPPIVASAGTVSLGMLCLFAANMGFNYALGPIGAIAIVCACAAMLTLLPAVLVLLGRWVFWPRIPRHGQAGPAHAPIWSRIGSWASRRPRMVWIGSVVILGVLAVGLTGAKTGLDNKHVVVGKPASIAGQELAAAHFPAGESQPVQVVVNTSAASQVVAAIHGVSGVSQVQQPLTSQDGKLDLLGVVLSTPDGSAAAKTTVTNIRNAVSTVPGANAQVGGSTATEMDKATAEAHDRKVVIPLVLAVVVIILALLLRSLLAPLLILCTVLMSYFATLGLSWQLFDKVFKFPALDVQLMLVGFLFLVALGVDYNIFLASRIREEAAEHGHEAGVLRGLTATGGVITSAGAVLAATFAALTTAPQIAFIEIGAFVAIGVLIDTFLVRSITVPALALDVGRTFWWPSRLSRKPRTAPAVPMDQSGKTVVDFRRS